MTQLLPWVFTTGWASGINPYLVVFALSLIDRFAGVAQIPDVFQRSDVMIVAGLLTLVDVAADKIAYIDSTWDAINTVIRPVVGTAIALLVAGDAATLEQALLAATGGVTALLSHLAKAGIRLGVNASPEPASNAVVSSAEDVAVIGVMATIINHPWIAAGVAGSCLLAGLITAGYAFHRFRRWRSRRRDPVA